MRGFAISFLTLACVTRSDFVLLFFCGMQSAWHRGGSDAIQFRTLCDNVADSCCLLPVYLVIRSVELLSLTQVWAANSLSRSASYFFFIYQVNRPRAHLKS
jgi:hypothetical protein